MTSGRVEIANVSGGYGAAKIVHDVSFVAEPAAVTVLIGGNGAGKTTIMRIIAGLLSSDAGDIRLDGESVRGMKSSERVERGVVLVPEGRLVFPQMSVLENLRLGAYAPRARAASRATMDRVFAMFPRLAERRQQLGGHALRRRAADAGDRSRPHGPAAHHADGRAEPGPGAAGGRARVRDRVPTSESEGLTILMAEQDVARSLAMADQAYVMEHGRIVLSGDGASLANDPRVREAYIGYA